MNILFAIVMLQTAPVDDDKELVLAVARVSANEAFGSAIDVALIWQVVENHGRTNAERLAWLRRHSSCATGVLSVEDARRRPGNCRWSRNLSPTLERPEGWPAGLSWKRRGLARWARHLWLAQRFVSGASRRRPCRGRPRTWGSTADHPGAVARGLERLDCGDTLNGGYRRAAR